MNTFRHLSVLALFSFLLLIACGEKEQEITVQSIAISQPSAELVIGETLSLKATVSPSNASYDGITWTSTKTTVATVSNSGLVSALSEGNTTITAMAGGKTASCSITVVKGYVAVSSISLNKESIELVEGDTESLTVTVSPNDATDKTITWTSSKEEVATVKDGIITAVKEGEATITAKAGDKTASCKVVVAKRVIPIESIELNRKELTLVEGDTETLIATVKPENATDITKSWKSSDNSIATVNDSGTVAAIKEGEATITVSAGDKTASCKVVIQKRIIPVTSIALDQNSIEIYKGETETLTATVLPDNATDKTIIWKSSDLLVATVEDGVVTAVGVGEAMISASAGDKTATCSVTVIQAPYYDFESNGIYYIIDNTDEVSVTYGPRKYSGKITLPNEVVYNGKSYKVTHLGYAVFYGCSDLVEFESGEGLVEIPISSFENCSSLSKVIIGKNVSLIAKDSFKGCVSLKEIKICDSSNDLVFESTSNSVSTAPMQFRDCPVESLYLGRNLQYELSWGAKRSPFPNTLKSVVFGSSISVIPTGCCFGCKELTQITLPSNIKHINPAAFEGTSIAYFSIPNTIESIGCNSLACSGNYSVKIEDGNNNLVFSTSALYPQSDPFNRKNLQDIYLGRNITYKDYVNASNFTNLYSPLAQSAIRKVEFGPHFTQIGSYLFYDCDKLETVSIPAQITSIKDNAFDECSVLQSIYVEAQTPITDINDNCFYTNTYINSNLFVPRESVSLYQKAEVWKNFRNIVGQ